MSEPNNESAGESISDVDWWASRLVDQEIAFADVPVDLRGAVDERASVFAAQRRSMLRAGLDHRLDPSFTERAVSAARVAASKLPASDTEASVVPLRRRLAPVLAVAAAAIGVIAVGSSVLQRDDRPDVIALDAVAFDVDPLSAESEKRSSTDVDATAGTAADDAAVSEMAIDESMVVESGPSDTAIPMSADAPTVDPGNIDPGVIEIATIAEAARLLSDWSITPPPTRADTVGCSDSKGRPAVALNVRFAGVDAIAFFSPTTGVSFYATADCRELASLVP